MLVHLGQYDVAERAHNAWLKAIEDGVHTYDIFKDSVSKQKVGTKEFAQAVVDRLGQKPEKLKAASYAAAAGMPEIVAPTYVRAIEKKELTGADVFIEFLGRAEALAAKLQPLEGDGLKLDMLSNRGMAVWPKGHAETFCVDVYRCRFNLPKDAPTPLAHKAIISLLERVSNAGLEFLKMELLYNFDGKPGYSLGQGQ